MIAFGTKKKCGQIRLLISHVREFKQ